VPPVYADAVQIDRVIRNLMGNAINYTNQDGTITIKLSVNNKTVMKKDDFIKFVNKIKTDRDELKLKMHLASMEVKEEFEEAEKKWDHVKSKVTKIEEETVETSDEYIAKAKIIGEELKETYRRIAKRLSE
jgi:signal transduction histidine kinase